MLRVRSPRPLLRALFAILCLQMVGGRPAHAEIIYVPDDYPTIQQAIEAAAEEGDEIIVHPGTYYKTIDFLGKAIWLHSSDGAAVTTIHGHNAERVVQCISGEGADTRHSGLPAIYVGRDSRFRPATCPPSKRAPACSASARVRR